MEVDALNHKARKWLLLGLISSSRQHFHIQTVEAGQMQHVNVIFSQSLWHNQFQAGV